MIDFSTLQGLEIPEGVVTQIADAQGRVIWAALSNKPVILEVKKITSDTYAGETTYTGEQFILLDIYPKTNGTVSVTYGGLTKTITDTSGAANPNAQQVFFGTFNGVTDEVETPASGRLTIEGEYYAFGCGGFSSSSKNSDDFYEITNIVSLGAISVIPAYAFGTTGLLVSGCSFSEAIIPEGVTSIGAYAFSNCDMLKHVVIPSSVINIGANPFAYSGGFSALSVTIKSGNVAYKMENNCIIEIGTKKLVSALRESVIPEWVTSIGEDAFAGVSSLSHITIPEGVTNIGDGAFTHTAREFTILATDPPTLGRDIFGAAGDSLSITVLSGCGEAYKTAAGWSEYADYITEAS